MFSIIKIKKLFAFTLNFALSFSFFVFFFFITLDSISYCKSFLLLLCYFSDNFGNHLIDLVGYLARVVHWLSSCVYRTLLLLHVLSAVSLTNYLILFIRSVFINYKTNYLDMVYHTFCKAPTLLSMLRTQKDLTELRSPVGHNDSPYSFTNYAAV